MIYDYAIVGSGPSGLILAYILQQIPNKSTIMFEKEDSIGGCHRVRRVENDLFTEHGPRIYINNYSILNNIIQENGKSWDDFFVPYKFGLFDSKEIFQTFSFRELLILFKEFLKFLVLPSAYGKTISVKEFTLNNNFSEKSIALLDDICRLTDGAGVDRYTMHELFEIVNQNALYSIYQPNKPNDKGLLYWLGNKLNNVYTNTEIIQITIPSLNNKKNTYMLKAKNGVTFYANNVIIAIPPIPLFDLLNKSQLTDAFISNSSININYLNRWIKESEYLRYIPITYHWDTKLQLKPIWGFPNTKWGVAFVNLSDYMTFESLTSKTLISALITKPIAEIDNLSVEQLKQGVFEQLKESYPDLPPATVSILSPGVYKKDNKWHTVDTAFMLSPLGFAPFGQESIKYKGLYNVGTHNGHSEYSFTSMQSAMENAVYLINTLGYPELAHKYKAAKLYTLRDIIIAILLIITIYVFNKF